jgi:hypothetical protein
LVLRIYPFLQSGDCRATDDADLQAAAGKLWMVLSP